jgi:hypothetical protein
MNDIELLYTAFFLFVFLVLWIIVTRWDMILEDIHLADQLDLYRDWLDNVFFVMKWVLAYLLHWGRALPYNEDHPPLFGLSPEEIRNANKNCGPKR